MTSSTLATRVITAGIASRDHESYTSHPVTFSVCIIKVNVYNIRGFFVTREVGFKEGIDHVYVSTLSRCVLVIRAKTVLSLIRVSIYFYIYLHLTSSVGDSLSYFTDCFFL